MKLKEKKNCLFFVSFKNLTDDKHPTIPHVLQLVNHHLQAGSIAAPYPVSHFTTRTTTSHRFPSWLIVNYRRMAKTATTSAKKMICHRWQKLNQIAKRDDNDVPSFSQWKLVFRAADDVDDSFARCLSSSSSSKESNLGERGKQKLVMTSIIFINNILLFAFMLMLVVESRSFRSGSGWAACISQQLWIRELNRVLVSNNESDRERGCRARPSPRVMNDGRNYRKSFLADKLNGDWKRECAI